MRLVRPVVVGAEQWANQQHGRAGGTHKTGQYRADGKNGCVQSRAAMQVSPNVNAACHSKQGREQKDKRNIFPQQRMHQAGDGKARAMKNCKGKQKGQRPGS